MIIQRTDPRFWDVRVLERRIRRGELTRADYETQLAALPDVAHLSTVSVPVEEPDARVRERRPMVRVSPPAPLSRLGDKGRLDDDDDILDDDDDDLDDEDEDEDDDDEDEDEK